MNVASRGSEDHCGSSFLGCEKRGLGKAAGWMDGASIGDTGEMMGDKVEIFFLILN